MVVVVAVTSVGGAAAAVAVAVVEAKIEDRSSSGGLGRSGREATLAANSSNDS